MELNPVTARLLQLMGEADEQTGRALLERIALELGYTDPMPVIEGGRATLAELRDCDVVLGVRA
jgi:hypothetical protein